MPKQSWVNGHTTITVLPIESAPIETGVSWGPCLLSPGLDLDWVIGEWDGEAWCSLSGFVIAPLYYGELPAMPLGDSGVQES